MPTLKTRANLGHPAIDLLLSFGLACANGIFRLGNLTLPRLQLFELKAALHGFQSQRLLTPSDLLFLCRCPPQ